jgi:signal transduction histidine kinase
MTPLALFRITISKLNGLALIRVSDKGYGVAKEDLNRIFERFVESEIGIGSTFFVELPM